MSEQNLNKQRTRDYFDAVDRNDTKAILDIYADDGVLEVMGSTLISGTFTKSDLRQLAGTVLDAFPDGLKYKVVSLVAEDDCVAVEAQSSGMHSSGQLYENQYHYLMRWRDGKLIHAKEYADTELATDILCGGQRPA